MRRVANETILHAMVLGGMVAFTGGCGPSASSPPAQENAARETATTEFAASAPAGQQDLLHGHWVYASGESEGSTTAVYGDLKLNQDGTFEDNRRIGGIGGFRKGKFRVAGDQLTLNFDGGKNSQTYAYSFDSSRDEDGQEIKTLLLKGTGLSFLLTKKEL